MKFTSKPKTIVLIVLPVSLIIIGALFYFYSGKQDPNQYICVGTGHSIWIQKIDNKDILILKFGNEPDKHVGQLDNGVLTVTYKDQQDLEKTRFALNQACKNKDGLVLFDSINEVVEKETK